MKIRCDRVDLADRLGSMLGIISATSPKPILMDFLLTVEDDHLVVEATDLKITGRVHVHKVEIEEGGSLALPSSRLLSILKEIPEDHVEIHSLDDPPGADIQSRGFKFKILGHDPREFPRLEESPEAQKFEVDRQKLYESLKRVAVAASKDPTRYQLNGVYFEVQEGSLVLTATDGKRLTHDRFKLGQDPGLELSFIVPNQAVDVILKVLSSPLVQDEKITLSVTETHVSVTTRDSLLCSTQIEGIYPNYRAIIPPEARVRATGKRGDLLTAARSAALTTDKQTSTVLFKVTPESLLMESNAQSIGESRIEIPVELTGDPVDFRFNPIFFIEALRTFEEDLVHLEITSPDKPILLKGSQSYLHLVMPLVVK